MKKAVLKLNYKDDKGKQKVMKRLSGLLSGVDSVVMDFGDKKLRVTGDGDPVTLVNKLRKICNTELLTFVPATEPEKTEEEPKKKEQTVVLKLDYRNDKDKQKVVKKFSDLLSGVVSFAMNFRYKELRVRGDVDPETLANKLRKICGTKIYSVIPAQEALKKAEVPKKGEPEKDERKKEKPKTETTQKPNDKKKDDKKKR